MKTREKKLTNTLYKTNTYDGNKKNIAMFYLKVFQRVIKDNAQEDNIFYTIAKKYKDYNIILITKSYSRANRTLIDRIEPICEKYGFAGYYVNNCYNGDSNHISYNEMINDENIQLLNFDFEKIIVNKYFNTLNLFVAEKDYNYLLDPNNHKAIKFVMHKYAMKDICYIIRLINSLKKPVEYIEYIIDPIEIIIPINFNQYVNHDNITDGTYYFGYNHSGLRLTKEQMYFDFVDDSNEKIYFMNFGFTYWKFSGTKAKQRRYYSDEYYNYLTSVFTRENDNIFFKGGEVNNFVQWQTYNHMTSQSLYTIIIPSYDPNHFSIFRLIDAVRAWCLPIVTDDCRIDMFTDKEQSILKKLMCDKFKVHEKVKEIEDNGNREDLLKELKEIFFN